MLLDFDYYDEWIPGLRRALTTHLPNDIDDQLRAADPQYVEDARDLLLAASDRRAVILAAVDWLRASEVAAYHGSRLTDQEVESIRSKGLLPLRAASRRVRLVRALSKHSRWLEVANRLDESIEAVGPGEECGRREGQVHLTLSRQSLIHEFNHYLEFGAEFDANVASILLGEEGKELLSADGDARIVAARLPGGVALEAANRYRTVEERVSEDEVPGVVEEFLEAFSYRLAQPDRALNLPVDCGFVFYDQLEPEWIIDVHNGTD